MVDIPAEAVQALVPIQQTIRRVLADAHLGDDVDELSARIAVAVAAELGGQVEGAAAQVRRETAARIAREIRRQKPAGNTPMTWENGLKRAARVASQIGEAG